MGTGDAGGRDLIDRLLDEGAEPPPEASSRATASTEAGFTAGRAADGPPPPPPGATFIVPDDWESSRAVRPLGETRPNVAATARHWIATGNPAVGHILRLAVFALAVIGGIAGMIVAWFHLTTDPLASARAYYEAAARLNAGQPLYPPGIDPSTNLAYLSPPLLAVVTRPLAVLGYQAFALAWEVVVLATFVLLVRHLGFRSQRTWLAIGILGIPIGWALSIAQAHVPMTLLLAIGQPWSIALATNLTLFPALIALWWLGRRDFEAVAAFAGWLALFALVQVALEPSGSIRFVQTVGLEQLGKVDNVSPFFVSPALWVLLLAIGIAATLLASRTRWGWPIAVAVATLASPRLLAYMLTGLLAAIREPEHRKPDVHEPLPWLHVSAGGRH